MVKFLSSSFFAVSLALTTGVFAHPHSHSHLGKRATCSTTYKAVAAGQYPELDCVPFTQDPMVQDWLKLVDMTKVPNYPTSQAGACPTNLTDIPADRCWWTCQKCDGPNDIVSCPKAGTWGLTYDDGPSPDTVRLLDNLKEHNQKATLFVVGSRVISNPDILKRAYSEGHHIAIHTWSHSAMTGLTNEQIVAELKWTEKAIHDVIGVTPLYFRPPYGDIDNRVRNIATQLGFKIAIWTQGFDTNDWNIPGGTATADSVIATFKSWLDKIPSMTKGFIVLQHDLFPQEVDVALNGILPVAYSTKGLTMQPIPQCLGDATPYKEGAGTFVLDNNLNSNKNSSASTVSNSNSSSNEKSNAVTVNAISPLSVAIVAGASIISVLTSYVF